MSHKEKLSGVFPPFPTPFVDQELACDKLAENIEKFNQAGLVGYMPLGSNGEFRSLTEAESLKVIDVFMAKKSPDKTLMVGAGRESASAAIDFIKKLADKGVDYASILPPHYFVATMTDDALIKHYTMVADKSPIPILLYNAPKFAAGLELSPELVATCAAHPNIVGMKDTSKEDISIFVQAVPAGEEFYVLAGTINKFWDGLTKGAVGGVLSIANYLPQMCVDLHQLYLAGDMEKGAKMDEYVRALSSNAAGKHGVSGVKAAMDLLGYFGGDPRVPLLPISDESKAALKAVLEKEGLL